MTGTGLLLLAIIALSGYAAKLQRADMEQQLGAQQQSTATFIAASVGRELALQVDALQKIAAPITPLQMRDPAQLLRLMAERPVFQGLFNAGTFVTDVHGTVLAQVGDTLGHAQAIASSGHLKGMHQTPVSSRIFVAEADGTSVSTAVPISDQSRIQGFLVGTNRLDRANFMDLIAKSRYGQSGAYVVYAFEQQRVVIASTLPPQAPGAMQVAVTTDAASMASLMRESEGSHVARGAAGSEVLVSNARIPHANWVMAVMLPTAEAFAIAADQQRRLWMLAALFALVLGFIAWWVLHWQFSPVRRTVQALQHMAKPGQVQHALAYTGRQEIDSLIGGFNQLLSVLADRNAELRRSFALNQNTLDSLEAQVAVLDNEGRVLSINKSWLQYLQLRGPHDDAAPPAATNYSALFQRDTPVPGGSHGTLLQAVQTVLEGQCAYHSSEYRVLTGEGERCLYVSVTPLDGHDRGAVLSRSDITERKRSEEQLRKLSQVAEQAPLAILITDLRGTIQYTNPHFSAMTGYTAAEVWGSNSRIFQSGRTPASTYQSLWETLLAGKVWRGEFLNLRKDGALLVERALIAPVIDALGYATHYVAIKEDITVAREQESARAALSVRIEELSRRLVRVQEESRQRFSQELHDRTSPNLAALRINLDIIARTMESLALDASMHDRIEDTRALIDDTTLSIREICADLHPAAIERGGLLGVVRTYCEQVSRRTGLRVDLRCPHGEKRLHADLELALFRIIQEALTNCVKHAQASDVEVRLQLDQVPLIVSIADNGQGFDSTPTLNGGPLRGLGLVNMRDTVDFAGGRMRLESSPGAGTRIYIEI
jgi:PAS domain S-box-containing protein